MVQEVIFESIGVVMGRLRVNVRIMALCDASANV